MKTVENIQSFNRYSYVSNNPLNAVDPSGYTDYYIGFSFGSDGANFEFGYSNDNVSFDYSGTTYEKINNANQNEASLYFDKNENGQLVLKSYTWYSDVNKDGIASNQKSDELGYRDGGAERFTNDGKKKILDTIQGAFKGGKGPGDIFSSQDEAAQRLADSINGISKDYNIEIGTIIYQMEGSENFSFHAPKTDFDSHTVNLSKMAFSELSTSARFHTHGGGNAPSSEMFSLNADLRIATNLRQNSYISTPGGQFKKFDYGSYYSAHLTKEYVDTPWSQRKPINKRHHVFVREGNQWENAYDTRY